MKKESLIVSAKKLEQPSQEAVIEFSDQKDSLIVEQKKRMKQRDDLDELVDGKIAMMEDNSKNMVDFLYSIFENYEPKVFVDTVHWVFRTYRSHGFKPDFWSVNLQTFENIMEEELSDETFDELNPFLQWIIEHVPDFVEMTDGYQKEGE
ncbi:MAG: hypothetical protein ACLFVB_03155 [Thermoplasmata archaeon]